VKKEENPKAKVTGKNIVKNLELKSLHFCNLFLSIFGFQLGIYDLPIDI
jgi:hypothetical protein